jgi:hypothetical protein
MLSTPLFFMAVLRTVPPAEGENPPLAAAQQSSSVGVVVKSTSQMKVTAKSLISHFFRGPWFLYYKMVLKTYIMWFLYYKMMLKTYIMLYPLSRYGSVDRASACRLKGPGFDSGQGHMPWLWAQSPVGACGRQPISDSLSSLMFLFLFPSRFLSEINIFIFFIYIMWELNVLR